MAAIRGFDPNTGQPIEVPQEAAATAYQENKLRFAPDERVPIVLDGVEGTIAQHELDDALSNGATLNFDPHGAVKAAAAGALRSVSLNASDWLAIEGRKLVGDRVGAEHARQELEGLRKEHPHATAVGEIGGALAQLAVPGAEEAGAEQLAAKGAAVAPREAAALSGAATGEDVAALTGAALKASGEPMEAAAAGNMAKGATQGASLTRAFRAIDPYTYIGKAGSTVGDQVARVLGEGRAARVAAPLADLATQGALIGAANAADEAELGDIPLTGEAVFAEASAGALWGTSLGLVGAAGKRILTGAGRMATKLAGGSIHATPAQMDRFTNRFKMNPGEFMLENGWNPAMSAERQYEWANGVKEEAGATIGRVVQDAGAGGNISAQEAYGSAVRAMERPIEQYGFAGGNAQGLKARIEQELKDSFGLRDFPEPPPPITPADIESQTNAIIRKRGLRPPKAWKEQDVLARAEEMVGNKPVGAQEVADFIRRRITTAREQGQDIAELLSSPGKIQKGLREEKLATAYATAKEEILSRYGAEVRAYENARSDVQMALEKAAGDQERTYQHAVSAVRESNAARRVDFQTARDVRIRLDKVIPWNYVNAADRVASAASEVKLAARSAIEDRVEGGIDAAARKLKDPELMGRYLHAKTRYAMATEIAKMARKGRARESVWFGRPSRVGGMTGHVGLGIGAAMIGHPFAGVAAMVGGAAAKHYGPRVAAWALHKAARLASIKALRQEVSIAARRGVRSTLGQAAHQPTARVGVPNLPPHEMRMTAAKAMVDVAKLAANPIELRSRLAAHDPGLSVIAPQTFDAAAGAFHRAVTYLATSIPPRLLTQYQMSGNINPRDISDHEAREWMDGAAVARDPRVAFDAMAQGSLTATQSKALNAIWPGIKRVGDTTLRRNIAMNHEALDYLHPSRKASLDMAFSISDPSFTLALQANAQALAAGNSAAQGPGKKGGPSGMQHASATSKGMGAMVNLMNTQAQAAESGPPGRRGRRSSSADSGL